MSITILNKILSVTVLLFFNFKLFYRQKKLAVNSLLGEEQFINPTLAPSRRVPKEPLLTLITREPPDAWAAHTLPSHRVATVVKGTNTTAVALPAAIGNVTVTCLSYRGTGVLSYLFFLYKKSLRALRFNNIM